MMRGIRTRGAAVRLGCALALALGLLAAGCGKKGNLEPVAGSELYRNVYPAPGTMQPDNGDEAPQ